MLFGWFLKSGYKALSVAILSQFTFVLGCVASNADSAHATQAPTACPTAACWHVEVAAISGGYACKVNGKAGPPSFRVYDIGRPGVPKLTSAEESMIRKISSFVNPRSMRFAFLDNVSEHHRFILFAIPFSKLCDSTFPPAIVLNGACNEYYSAVNLPVEKMSSTTAAMGCVNPPRPWVHGDQGTGTNTWSTQIPY